MFERFTEKALMAIRIALTEARRLGHNDVSPEFILLGLIEIEPSIPSQILKSMGVELERARLAVERRLGHGSGLLEPEMPFTPSAKRLIFNSWEEAKNAHVNHIGTEHLLLALIGIDEDSLKSILQALGVDPVGTREAVLSATENFNEEKEKLVKDSSQSSSTENADRVIFLAQEEARRLGHNFVGTEQILLALISADKGVAAKTLNSLGVNLEDTRMRVEEIIGRGTDVLAREIPFTPRARKILLLAWDEARGLGNNYVLVQGTCCWLFFGKEMASL